MWQVRSTEGPCFSCFKREELVDDSYDLFSPLLLGNFVHLIDQDGLDKPMDRERGGFSVTADERVGQQFSQGIIQLQRVAGKGLKQRAEVVHAFGNQCFRNSIRREKRTVVQKFSRCGVGLLYLLKGE